MSFGVLALILVIAWLLDSEFDRGRRAGRRDRW
jgi:hypothetical protein